MSQDPKTMLDDYFSLDHGTAVHKIEAGAILGLATVSIVAMLGLSELSEQLWAALGAFCIATPLAESVFMMADHRNKYEVRMPETWHESVAINGAAFSFGIGIASLVWHFSLVLLWVLVLAALVAGSIFVLFLRASRSRNKYTLEAARERETAKRLLGVDAVEEDRPTDPDKKGAGP